MSRAPALPRRRFIRIVLAGVAAAPLAARVGAAAAAERVSETDPAARELKYRADATKAPERKDAKAFCDNCAFYSGKPGAASGECAALDNRLVAAKGWCQSWDSL
jgi:hypothetical protein